MIDETQQRMKRLVRKHIRAMGGISLTGYARRVGIPQSTFHTWLKTPGRCLRWETAVRLRAYLGRRGYK